MAGVNSADSGRGWLQRVLCLDDDKYALFAVVVRNFTSELFGAGLLVFLGCMSVVKGLGQPGDHTGVVLSFALAVFTAIQICCHNSGGHVNPAVTVVSVFFHRLSIPMALVYIAGQLTGAVLGFGLLKYLTPSHLLHEGFPHGMCTVMPHPALSLDQAFFAEFVLTCVLMLVVCSAWDPRNNHLHDSLTLKFGFAIYSLAYAGIAYSGCGMNPARSFGPAVWNNVWTHHWIFWVAPTLAALFTGYIYTTFYCAPLPPLQPAVPNRSKPVEHEQSGISA